MRKKQLFFFGETIHPFLQICLVIYHLIQKNKKKNSIHIDNGSTNTLYRATFNHKSNRKSLQSTEVANKKIK